MRTQFLIFLLIGFLCGCKTSQPTDSTHAYAQTVRRIYMQAWEPATSTVNGDSTAEVSIVIGKDGSVISARIKTLSENEPMDKSLQAMLDKIKFIQPFENGANDDRRVFTFNINLRVNGENFQPVKQSVLEDARNDIEAQHYDAAISILQNYVASNTNSANGEIFLARAYHWKKDYAQAKLHYQKAATIEPRYRCEIVPLLDDLGESDEIIQIAATEANKGGSFSPSVLGPLATAYKNKNEPVEAERIKGILLTTTYESQTEEDYKNYVLAYCALWNDDNQQAKNFLKKMQGKSLLKYARTQDKFKKLYGDEEFLELTK